MIYSMGKMRKIKLFLKNHKYSAFIVFVAVMIAGLILWDSMNTFSTFEMPKINLKKEAPKETRVRAPLSGVMVSPDLAKKRTIAVVIENHPEARPQSGLNKASLVYETVAEGGITRMLAVFQENDPSEIGPVRSARTHFVYWARELESVFGHIGGSEDALSLIKSVGVLDFNQFYNGASFWRDNGRAAPHNVYTSISKVRSGAKKLGYSEVKEVDPFEFKEDISKEERPDAQSISIDFSSASYKVLYVYGKESNEYKRSVAGVSHKDKTSGEQLTAKNIIVQYTDIIDRAGKDTQAKVVGSGKIKYFRDGKSFAGKWEKKTNSSRTKYLDEKGAPIELNAGQTWISVVRTTSSVIEK